jgi:hypothetical protein
MRNRDGPRHDARRWRDPHRQNTRGRLGPGDAYIVMWLWELYLTEPTKRMYPALTGGNNCLWQHRVAPEGFSTFRCGNIESPPRASQRSGLHHAQRYAPRPEVNQAGHLLHAAMRGVAMAAKR